MSVPDVLNQPWAITRDKYDQICAVYERHVAGQSLSAESVKALTGAVPRPADQPNYTVQDGVAVIPVEGVLAKKMNLFTAISGGMSTQMLVDTVNEAMSDDAVHSLMLSIDSPGGEVDGTQQIADALAGATKPTAAWIDGMACSAALWIASQCDSIYAASDTATVGSMGVLIQHADYSKANEAQGKSVTHITTGKYKVAGNSAQPLSQDDRAYLQDRVDYLYTLFLSAVADGRGMDPQTLDDVAGDAQVFFAQQAIDNGLIDGIADQDQVVQMLNQAFQQQGSSAAANSFGGSAMKTYSEIDFNAAVASAREAGRAEAGPVEFERGKVEGATAAFVNGKAEGLKAGAEAERERIKAVEAQSLAGHEGLIAAAKFDGKTTGPEAAVQIINAERALRGTKAAAIEADAAAANVVATAPGAAAAADRARLATPATPTTAEYSQKIKAYMALPENKGVTLAQAAAAISAS